MRALPLALLLLLLSACTTTTVTKFHDNGKLAFKATNLSIGWDRENVSLDLIKTKEETAIQIGIGKSGGSEGLGKAIKMMEDGLAIMKGAAAPGL